MSTNFKELIQHAAASENPISRLLALGSEIDSKIAELQAENERLKAERDMAIDAERRTQLQMVKDVAENEQLKVMNSELRDALDLSGANSHMDRQEIKNKDALLHKWLANFGSTDALSEETRAAIANSQPQTTATEERRT